MVEQEAVNFEVAGSSPAVGAKHRHYDESHGVFVCIDFQTQNYKLTEDFKKARSVWLQKELSMWCIRLFHYAMRESLTIIPRFMFHIAS